MLVAASVDFPEVVAIGRDPTSYQANVVSRLPNDCARFDRLTVELDRTARVFTIEVLNLVPMPDANVGCTLEYGQIDHAVLLEGV